LSYYLDTSVLAKLYHQEAGSSRVQEIYYGEDEVLISELARVELLSVISRRYRDGSISSATYDAIIARFAEDALARFSVIPFSQGIIAEAEKLLTSLGKRMPLRSLDMLQFAFYLAHQGSELVFVCADGRLLLAVSSQGFSVLNPNFPS